MTLTTPYVQIYSYQGDKRKLKELAAGLEEESMECQIHHQKEHKDAYTLARQAAQKSPKGLGLGLSQKELALVIDDSPGQVNLDIKKIEPRQVGQNCARYLKKKPLFL